MLFAVAYIGDRHARTWSSSRLGPVVYGLSLAIYCTSWTFYGAVGRAATSGPDFILIYVGPVLVVLAGYPLLRKIIITAKRHNVTSIADFLGSRYGKSRAVAVSATLIASVGALPYIALQLQAVSSSFTAIAGPSFVGAGSSPLADTSFIIAALMALFTILFGVRHVQAAEQHRGMMLAIAFESVVKVVALLAVGPFVIFGLFDGPSDLIARIATAPGVGSRLEGSASGLSWMVTTALSACAFLCLPRQFHVAVVEYDHPSSLKTARWLFPIYLLLINLFVVPIAAGGLLLLPQIANPDLFVLILPLSNNEAWLSLLVFIGGLSAATSMVIVACMALSGMIGNELVMPLLLRRRATAQGDLGPLVLLVRRAAVVVIVLAGYAYHRTIAGYLPLASIGMISFVAVANFMPGLVFGLYWRRANRFGVVAGLAGGFGVWLYGLLIPSLKQARGADLATPLTFYLPEPLSSLDPIGQGFLAAFAVNTTLLIIGSLVTQARRRDREQADAFVLGAEAPHPTQAGGDASSRIEELRDLVARFIGVERADRAFADPELSSLPAALATTERLLSGTIGAASARVIMAAVERRRLISPRAARAMLDEASEAIRYSSEILRNALDHAGLGIAAFDRESRLEIWNERFPTLLGLNPDMVTVGARADTLADFLKRPEAPQVLETRGSTTGVVELRLDPLPGGGFVATCHDVTERVRAAEALRDSERRIRIYTDNVPVLIAYIDRDERYRFTNQQYQSALSLAPAEAEGRTIIEVIGEARYRRLKPHIDGVLRGERQTFEIEFPTNDANIEVARGTYIPHFDDAGTVAGFFLLYQDTTQERAAEAALRQSKETLERRVAERTSELERSRAEAEAANLGKTRFIAAASHDLLQPLHAARLFTAALADRQPGNDLVAKIDQGLGAVEALLDALLDISKLDAGALKPEKRAIALQPLLDSLAAAFVPFASRSGATLKMMPSTATISTDPALLRRILQNFVSNALRYGGGNGRTPRVVLGCRRTGTSLRIEVWDNGPGIPEDKRDLVFQEFVRLHPAASDRDEGRGLGLGLAIVDRIARILGHKVALRSSPGRGSIFSITVPLATASVTRTAPQPQPPAVPGFDTGAFVLCIDDEPRIRDAMAALLGGWGCRILTVGSQDEGLAALAEEGRAPDLLIVDHHLGEGPNGLAVIERIRADWGTEVAAALITADRDPTLRAQARARRVDLLLKPVKPAALRALLRGRSRGQPAAALRA